MVELLGQKQHEPKRENTTDIQKDPPPVESFKARPLTTPMAPRKPLRMEFMTDYETPTEADEAVRTLVYPSDADASAPPPREGKPTTAAGASRRAKLMEEAVNKAPLEREAGDYYQKPKQKKKYFSDKQMQRFLEYKGEFIPSFMPSAMKAQIKRLGLEAEYKRYRPPQERR
jgi:hypothetical protein